jgi:hypothetical protein
MVQTRHRAVRVGLLGHSYTRRLDYFMADPRHGDQYRNLGLDETHVLVWCFGLGGERVVPGYKSIREQVDLALADECTMLFLHIGENDLNL